MKRNDVFGLVFALGLLLVSAKSSSAGDRNSAQYNLSSGIALKGYDPVSYFPEGGGSPRIGLAEIPLTYLGTQYFFSDEAK